MKENKLPKKTTEVYKIWRLINKANRPLHVKEIAKGIGIPTLYTERKMRHLLSMLWIYAQQKLFFKRVSKGTYGLLDKKKVPVEVSVVYRILEVLKKRKREMHVNEIMEEMGLKFTYKTRNNISATIRQYAKNGKYFKKVGPAKFEALR